MQPHTGNVTRRDFLKVAAAGTAGAAVAPIVAACGSSSSGTSKGGGTIVLWVSSDAAINGIVKDFEKQHPNYKVQMTGYPWTPDLHDKEQTGLATGAVPDVMEAQDQDVGPFAQVGGLAPLDDFKKQEGFSDSEFVPGAWSHWEYKGHIWAAPAYNDLRGLFYNKDVLSKAGFTGTPKTLTEILQYTKISNGSNLFALADQTSDLDFHFFSCLLYENGGDYTNSNGKECTLTNAAAIRALSFYQKLYQTDTIPKNPSKRADPWEGFKGSYYAMAESGSWWFALLAQQAPDLSGKWSVAPFPTGKTNITYGHPQGWCVPAKAKNPDGGKAWIAYMMRPDVQAKWFTPSGLLPSRLAAYKDSTLANNKPVQTLLADGKRGTNSIHNVPNATQIINVVASMLSSVKNGEDIRQQASSAKSQVDQLLTQQGG